MNARLAGDPNLANNEEVKRPSRNFQDALKKLSENFDTIDTVAGTV